jgi:hypothetical protein
MKHVQAYNSHTPNCCTERREPSGMPSLYFPVNTPEDNEKICMLVQRIKPVKHRPEARGDHMVEPRPRDLYKREYSTSKRSRCSKLYYSSSDTSSHSIEIKACAGSSSIPEAARQWDQSNQGGLQQRKLLRFAQLHASCE